MFQLWARRRVINGVGFPYEFIFDFYDESYKYSALDTLDRSIYEEAMIVRGQDCILYVEFEKPLVLKRKRY